MKKASFNLIKKFNYGEYGGMLSFECMLQKPEVDAGWRPPTLFYLRFWKRDLPLNLELTYWLDCLDLLVSALARGLHTRTTTCDFYVDDVDLNSCHYSRVPITVPTHCVISSGPKTVFLNFFLTKHKKWCIAKQGNLIKSIKLVGENKGGFEHGHSL